MADWSDADREQAEVFRMMLDQERAGLSELLDAQRGLLARYEDAGDRAQVLRMRRVISAIESEVRSIDRMIGALGHRFPPMRHP